MQVVGVSRGLEGGGSVLGGGVFGGSRLGCLNGIGGLGSAVFAGLGGLSS